MYLVKIVVPQKIEIEEKPFYSIIYNRKIEQTGSYVTDTIILHITIKTNDVVPYKSVLILWKGIVLRLALKPFNTWSTRWTIKKNVVVYVL